LLLDDQVGRLRRVGRFGDFAQDRRTEMEGNVGKDFVVTCRQRHIQEVAFIDGHVRVALHVLAQLFGSAWLELDRHDFLDAVREDGRDRPTPRSDVIDGIGRLEVRVPNQLFNELGAAQEVLRVGGEAFQD